MKKSKIIITSSASLLTLTMVFLYQAEAKNPAFECPGGKTYPVTLTFDDGPHPELTPRVLDVLKEEKVKGTFFVLGEHFPGGKSNPANANAYALLDREKKEGHYIGSHTYHHLAHNTLSEAKARENIEQAKKVLEGYTDGILRLPYGAGSFKSSNPAQQAKNDMVMGLVKSEGYSHVGWHIDTNDWDPKKRAHLLESTMKQICESKGGIILFHDIQRNTVDHLKEWIQAIKEQGHTFVGLEHFKPELAKSAPTPSADTPKQCGNNISNKDYEKLDELGKLMYKITNKCNK